MEAHVNEFMLQSEIYKSMPGIDDEEDNISIGHEAPLPLSQRYSYGSGLSRPPLHRYSDNHGCVTN